VQLKYSRNNLPKFETRIVQKKSAKQCNQNISKNLPYSETKIFQQKNHQTVQLKYYRKNLPKVQLKFQTKKSANNATKIFKKNLPNKTNCFYLSYAVWQIFFRHLY
jgi:hypothetical protein